MNWKLFNVLITAFAAISFMYLWYAGEQVSAWQPLLWCVLCFFHELEKYLDPLSDIKKYF